MEDGENGREETKYTNTRTKNNTTVYGVATQSHSD